MKGLGSATPVHRRQRQLQQRHLPQGVVGTHRHLLLPASVGPGSEEVLSFLSHLGLYLYLYFRSGEFDGEIRSIFIKGLPKKDHDEVETLLWGLFEEFEPQAINLISTKGVAYVKVGNYRALKSLPSSFNRYRALRTFAKLSPSCTGRPSLPAKAARHSPYR